MPRRRFTSIEVCAGAGGQALGLEQAGFRHLACVELEPTACQTLRLNREDWNVIEADLRDWIWKGSEQVDLVAGGVPCPPYSIAGRQLGADDDRDLFPAMMRLIKEVQPRAVLIENVRGLLQSRFDEYRAEILLELARIGYVGSWRLLQAADYGVPQLRPRSLLVALRPSDFDSFKWPEPKLERTSVGDVLRNSMSQRGWPLADAWADSARGVAPTLVGGSKRHGGPDLGPTRAKKEWMLRFGVDGLGLADEPPGPDHVGPPRLTAHQAALLQGFPADWKIYGRKTAAYRQIGNAFPPPVAKAVGTELVRAFRRADNVGMGLNNASRRTFAAQ